MHLDLIESLNLPGDPAKPNEDAFMHGAHFAAVFDGATGLGEQLLPGASDAQWIARFGARRLAAHAQSGEGSPRDWLRAAATDAERSYAGLRRRPPKDNYEIAFASLMFVALDRDGLDVLWFGDCSLLHNAHGIFATIGDTMDSRAQEQARVRALTKSHASDAGPAAPAVRAQFLPALRTSRNAVNTEKGEWLFAPNAACADHAHQARMGVAPGTALLLASDGFLALASDYGRCSFEGLFSAAEQKGLKALGAELREVEAGDPEGLAFPRFKKGDDATAVLLRVAA